MNPQMTVHDLEIFNLIALEKIRQQDQVELIASENIVSESILRAQGSILTNKYAEGYPKRRYYGGCAHVDEIESLALQRACLLFGCEQANVQPHSGSQANQSVFLALLQPGVKIMGLGLADGGHLTHGAAPSLSGKWFQGVSYGVDPKTHLIDENQVETLAKIHKPNLIIAGGTAYPRHFNFERFRTIADAVDAYLMVDIAHVSGLIAAKCHPSPFPHAHVVTSTTHKTLRGPRGGLILWNDKSLTRQLNSAVFPGLQGGPLMHTIAAKAICFQEALDPTFQEYGKNVLKTAKKLGQTLQERGLSLVTGGTDTHLLLVDLTAQQMSGKQAEFILEQAGLTCNKNSIPYDPRPFTETSGIRLGTAAGVTRGFGLSEFEEIGHWIADVLEKQDDITITKTRQQVRDLCTCFPIYPGH